ncbi:MAG: CYTH domain-containing protein [Eubacterium sp.]|nr:CYTH domain-containing protein [Eubacterium sp.]
MEIERNFIPKCLPDNLDSYEHHDIQQAYLNTSPVIRIRKQDEDYFLTYKGSGMMSREEYNLPLNQKSYFHLLTKADGNIITKTRYLIPLFNSLTAELDIFHDIFDGRLLVEVEFNSIEDANSFIPPEWFGEDVTYDKKYHNSNMSKEIL